jgi:hypothetical protein
MGLVFDNIGCEYCRTLTNYKKKAASECRIDEAEKEVGSVID